MAHAYASTQVLHRDISAYEAAVPPERAGECFPSHSDRGEGERELREALTAGADSVLLDNMTPERARSCVSLARSLRTTA